MARHLYIFEEFSFLEIAFVLTRNYDQVKQIVSNQGWPKIRARINKEIEKEFVQGTADKLEHIIGLSTSVIEKYFVKLLKSDNIGKVTMKDAKLASDIMANYHRVVQLIKNKPTSITKAIESMSQQELVEAAADLAVQSLRDDPMYNTGSEDDEGDSSEQVH